MSGIFELSTGDGKTLKVGDKIRWRNHQGVTGTILRFADYDTATITVDEPYYGNSQLLVWLDELELLDGSGPCDHEWEKRPLFTGHFMRCRKCGEEC
jgi:hypothetical protein